MEIWRNVVEFPDLFMISNKGRIWSKRTHKILKQTIGATGYPTLSTRIGGRKGTAYCRKTHRLVAEAFIDNPHNKPFVNHLDGDKLNSSVDNLEWCTAKENSEHAFQTGLCSKERKQGWENSQSKLSEDDVIYLRTVYTPRHKMFGARKLADELGVAHSTVMEVYNRVSYRNVA